jgi:hypothetical protein
MQVGAGLKQVRSDRVFQDVKMSLLFRQACLRVVFAAHEPVERTARDRTAVAVGEEQGIGIRDAFAFTLSPALSQVVFERFHLVGLHLVEARQRSLQTVNHQLAPLLVEVRPFELPDFGLRRFSSKSVRLSSPTLDAHMPCRYAMRNSARLRLLSMTLIQHPIHHEPNWAPDSFFFKVRLKFLSANE